MKISGTGESKERKFGYIFQFLIEVKRDYGFNTEWNISFTPTMEGVVMKENNNDEMK